MFVNEIQRIVKHRHIDSSIKPQNVCRIGMLPNRRFESIGGCNQIVGRHVVGIGRKHHNNAVFDAQLGQHLLVVSPIAFGHETHDVGLESQPTRYQRHNNNRCPQRHPQPCAMTFKKIVYSQKKFGHIQCVFLNRLNTAQLTNHTHTPANTANTHAPSTYCHKFTITDSNVTSLNSSETGFSSN